MLQRLRANDVMQVPNLWNNEKTEEEVAFFTSGYLIFCFPLKSKHVHKRYQT